MFQVICRPGRTCIATSKIVQCVCATSCPDHWKPVSSQSSVSCTTPRALHTRHHTLNTLQVCGSDGVSYDNHCELHRAACTKGEHVSPLHTGFCWWDIHKNCPKSHQINQLTLSKQITKNIHLFWHSCNPSFRRAFHLFVFLDTHLVLDFWKTSCGEKKSLTIPVLKV